jgi:hypothetical protein
VTLRIEQDATYVGRDRWKWSVWIEGPADELNGIEAVTYYLHPTFPEPVQVATNRRSKFRLDASGWGTFVIKAEIKQKDGKLLKRSHSLQLEYPEEAMEEAANRRGEGRPTVFVASSVADRPVVSALREALAREDVDLIADSDLDLNLPWEVSVKEALRSSDAAIALVTDFTSPSVESEIQLATAMDIPVLSVRVGTGRGAPDSTSEVQAVRLTSAEDIRQAATQVVRGINSLLKGSDR